MQIPFTFILIVRIKQEQTVVCERTSSMSDQNISTTIIRVKNHNYNSKGYMFLNIQNKV